MALSTSSAINTNCDGFGCNYSGPSILINEVMIRPSSGDGSIFGNGQGAGPQSGEWIELYNPDLCRTIDISCYFLGNNSPDGSGSQTFGGGFELPMGTIVPTRGFCIVRGIYAPPVPSNLLVQNGGRTVEVIVDNSNSVCIGGGYRLWFPNAGGWFAFYNRNGVPQDAISWNNNETSGNNPCNPPGNCPFTGTLPSYANIPANRKTYIYPNQPQMGLSIRRLPDGGNWATGTQAAETYGNCNAVCAPPPVITCTGWASVAASGGNAPYSYKWDDGQAQTNDTAFGLCGGTYCVTVFDATGDSAVACVLVDDMQPQVTFASLPPVCVGTPPFALNAGIPAGGTYAGPGVVNNVFNSVLAGTGNHVISYTYADPDSCEKTVTSIQVVHPIPTANLPAVPNICTGDGSITLTGGSPPGGIYSGPGVTGNTFDPASTGPGSFMISYIVSNTFGCWDTATQTFIVRASPSVSLGNIPALCANSPPLALSSGSPSGGTYSGTAITANVFNPAVSGPGSFPIGYTYTSPNGCSSSALNSIMVHPLPTVTLDTVSSACVGGTPVILNTGQPPGGTYSGTGVSGGTFNPVLTGPGLFPITYTYQDQNGCIASAIHNIHVALLPQVALQPLAPLCVNSTPVVLGGGTPPGGSFSGPGVAAGVFNPAVTGVGTFILTYKYSDIYGCTDSAHQSQTVLALPQLSLSLPDTVCLNALPLSLSGGSPVGGNYSGPGVTGGTFDPSLAGTGSHPITYTFTDGNNCTATITQSVVVPILPAVVFSPLTHLCASSQPVILAGGTPAGGTYSGPGVASGVFSPSLAGVGSFNLIYSYTNGNGCTNSDTTVQTVYPLPQLLQAPISNVCINAPYVNLTGSGTPAGGTYTGPGVTFGAWFIPSLTGLGTFMITYHYADTNGCVDSIHANINVVDIPVVSLTPFSDVCQSSIPFLLTGGSPSGGSYSGLHVNNGYFDPLAPASYVITYTYVDNNGCSNSTNQTINVLNLPEVTFSYLKDLCIDHLPDTLSGGYPLGGTYSGPGITNGVFDPLIAGAGTFTLVYTFNDSLCSDTAQQSITVRQLPAVTFSSLANVCLNADTVALTGGAPMGGTYSGAGVNNGAFLPASAGTGTHPIQYTFKDQYNCTNTASQNIMVVPLPLQFHVEGGPINCEDVGSPVTIDSSQLGVNYSLVLNGINQGFPYSGTGSSFSFGNQTVEGTYYVVAMNTTTGCKNDMLDSALIKLILLPDPHLEDSMSLCELHSIQLDAGTFPDSVVYQWQDGSTGRYFTLEEPGIYWVRIGRGDCIAIDTVEVWNCCQFEISNVFTPNGDEHNDRFIPKYYCELLKYQIEIFNRWGKRVYQSSNIDEGWDGTNSNEGSECSEGTYFFVINYTSLVYPEIRTGRKVTGSVTLLR